jgi:hypothetical protein
MDDGSQFCAQGSADSRGRKRVAWRRDPAILARLPRVERLHLAGRTLVAIGAEVGISEATVRDDLKRVQELWRERAGGDIADQRAQIIAELDDTRRRALEAAEWDQMCERAVLFGGSIEDEDGPNSVYRDKKGSAQFRGNKAAALAQARQATMDKAKLLGLVVDKAALTDGAGDDIPLDALMERFARRQAGQEATEGDG